MAGVLTAVRYCSAYSQPGRQEDKVTNGHLELKHKKHATFQGGHPVRNQQDAHGGHVRPSTGKNEKKITVRARHTL